jgi:hypothetical protein
VCEAQIGQATQDAEQDTQAIAGGTDLEGAHQRRVQRGDIGLDDLLGDAFGK